MKVTVQYLPASHTVTHNVSCRFTEPYLFPKKGYFLLLLKFKNSTTFLWKGSITQRDKTLVYLCINNQMITEYLHWVLTSRARIRCFVTSQGNRWVSAKQKQKELQEQAFVTTKAHHFTSKVFSWLNLKQSFQSLSPFFSDF